MSLRERCMLLVFPPGCVPLSWVGVVLLLGPYHLLLGGTCNPRRAERERARERLEVSIYIHTHSRTEEGDYLPTLGRFVTHEWKTDSVTHHITSLSKKAETTAFCSLAPLFRLVPSFFCFLNSGTDLRSHTPIRPCHSVRGTVNDSRNGINTESHPSERKQGCECSRSSFGLLLRPVYGVPLPTVVWIVLNSGEDDEERDKYFP